MSGGAPDPGDDTREGELLRRVIARAVRRLDLLEYVVLGVAAILATLAGALVAFLVSAGTELSFRSTWPVASVFFFVVPAALAWRSTREREPDDGPGGRNGDRTPRTGTTRQET